MADLVQQLTEELTAQTKRGQALQQIVDELFTIATPGAVKNALWARYQGIEGASPEASEAISNQNQGRRVKPRVDIEAVDAEAQAREDWSNDE